MKTCLTLLTAAVQAGVPGLDGRNLAGGAYDYKTENGKDWPDLTVAGNKCGEAGTQSPIDLPSGGGNRYSASDDNFNKMYYNQVDAKWVPVKWVGDTSKVETKYNDVAKSTGTSSFFYSEFGAVMGGPT